MIRVGRTLYEVARNAYGYAVVWKVDGNGNRITVHGRRALDVARAVNRKRP